MKIVAVADIHGHLIDIPSADILCIGGDIVPLTANKKYQTAWLQNEFNSWLDSLPVKHKVLTWGNHDEVAQENPNLNIHAHVLVDKLVELDGVRVWGSPWQPVFGDWAFNLKEEELAKKWELIPENLDILLLHGPPRNHCDKAPSMYKYDEWENTGSPALTRRIEKVQPRHVICGHIHCSHGHSKLLNSEIHNVAIVNEKYWPIHKPYEFNL